MRVLLATCSIAVVACGGVGPAPTPAAYVAVATFSEGTWLTRYDGVTLTDAAESPRYADDVTMFAAVDTGTGNVFWVHGGPRSGAPATRWQVDVLGPDLVPLRSKLDSEIVATGDTTTTPVTGPGILLAGGRLLVVSAVRGAGKLTHGLLVLDADRLDAVGFYPVNALYSRLVPGPGAALVYVLTATPQAGGQELVLVDVRTGAVLDSAVAGGAVALAPSSRMALCLETPDSLALIDPISLTARLTAPLDFEGPMLSVGPRGWIIVADGAFGGTREADVFDATDLGHQARLRVLPDSIAEAPNDLGTDPAARYLYVATEGASLGLAGGHLALVDLDARRVVGIVPLAGPGRVVGP